MTTNASFSADRAPELLDHPDLVPPPVTAGATGGLAWLRADVARFATGASHARRRAQVMELLSDMDLERLRLRAAELARLTVEAAPGSIDIMAQIARDVPIRVLAEAIGFPAADVDAVRTVAAAYLSGEATAECDAAVEALVATFGGEHGELTAARIGLLVQACEATAALIGNTLAATASEEATAEEVTRNGTSCDAVAGSAATSADQVGSGPSREGGGATAAIMAQLRDDPPVRATIRMAAAEVEIESSRGNQVEGGLIRLVPGDRARIELSGESALPFGAGPHACPGREQATAIAIGTCEVFQGLRPQTATVEYEPLPNLRIPARLEVNP